MIIQRKRELYYVGDKPIEELWEDLEIPAEGFESTLTFLTSLDDSVGTVYRIIGNEEVSFASVELPPPATKYVSM